MSRIIVPEPSHSKLTRLGERQQGPVEILCREIGFDFDPLLERPDVLVAFVGSLVSEIAESRHIAVWVTRVGGQAPTDASAEVLQLTEAMLQEVDPGALRAAAELVHDAAHRLNPDDAYPTDHLIDMLSSCASAIRFGLETPCQSRHAAEAANHVWKRRYGVSMFDRYTGDWEKSWARRKLLEALIGLLPPAPASVISARDGSGTQKNTPSPNPETP